MVRRSQKIAYGALFSSLIVLPKAFLPPVYDEAITLLPQSLLLVLSNLIIGSWGATSVSLISGIILSVIESGYAIFAVSFSVFYGFLIDLLILWNKKRRLWLASGIATAITGLTGYMITSVMLRIVPIRIIIAVLILIIGIIEGALGGFLASRIYPRLMRASI